MSAFTISRFASPLWIVSKKAAIVPVIAAVMAIAVSTTVAPSPAEAASPVKKVQVGLEFGARTFRALEQAGRRAQQSRGIGRVTGGILKQVGGAGNNVSSGLARGVGTVSNGINNAVGRTPAGRTVQGAVRGAQRWKTDQVNQAFRHCRGLACSVAKDVVNFALPF